MSTAGFPVKIIFDTSIYIPFINQGIEYSQKTLNIGKSVYYMSAVVIEELYAGAFDNASIRQYCCDYKKDLKLDSKEKEVKNYGRNYLPLLSGGLNRKVFLCSLQ